MTSSDLLEDRVHYLLNQLNVDSLKDICRKKKLRGFSKFKKAELVDFIVDSISESSEELNSLISSILGFQTFFMLEFENKIIDLLKWNSNELITTFIPRGMDITTCTLKTDDISCSCADFTDFSAICSHIKATVSLGISDKLLDPSMKDKFSLEDEIILLAGDNLKKRQNISPEYIYNYLENEFAFSGRFDKAKDLQKVKFDLNITSSEIEGNYLGKDPETGDLKPVFKIKIDRKTRRIYHNCNDFVHRTSRIARACKHLVGLFLLFHEENKELEDILKSITVSRWRFEVIEI